MDDTRFANIDWNKLLAKLQAVAEKLFATHGLVGDASILPGTGKSAEDLVFETIELFALGKVDWRADEDPFPLLVTVMWRDFLDLLKRSSHRKTTNVDSLEEEESRGILPFVRNDANEQSEEVDDQTRERVYSIIGNDQDLRDYVDAVFEFDCIKPHEIADLLGISANECRNRQRRLRTRLAAWYRSVTRNHRRARE